MFTVVCLRMRELGNPYEKLAGPYVKRESAELALRSWEPVENPLGSGYFGPCVGRHVIEETEAGLR